MVTFAAKSEVTLPSDREVLVSRAFRAPKELVYEAYTTPELVRRWCLGPPGWSMPVCEIDLRVGGGYHWRWRSDKGDQEFGFRGTYKEIVPNERIVHSEIYEPGNVGGSMENAGECLVTITFEEEDGVATLTTRMDFGSKEARDAAVATGMTDGMEQSYQLLEGLLAEKA